MPPDRINLRAGDERDRQRLTVALERDEVVRIQPESVADGLGAPFAGVWTLAMCRRYLDGIVLLVRGLPRRVVDRGVPRGGGVEMEVGRFVAAAELIESDLWQQYAELGGLTPGQLPVETAPFTAMIRRLSGS